MSKSQSQKTKIIQVTTFFHPVSGGVETQVLEISKNLQNSGFEVEVFTTDSNRNNEKLSVTDSTIEGIFVKRFKTWFSFSKFHKFAPGIFFALMRSDANIIHVHGFRKPEVYFAIFAAKLNRKKPKVVVTTHNPFTTNIRSRKLNLFVKLHDATFGKWFSKLIDKIIAIVPSEKNFLINKFNVKKENIEVIPNGISDIFYEKIADLNKATKWSHSETILKEIIPEDSLTSKLLNQDTKIVLAACRLNEVKGLQNLKLAADKFSKEKLALKKTLFLFLGGDDGYKKNLEILYRNNPNVFISGKYIRHEKLREFYEIADIFVLPSLHEPFGLTPVEAVATGTPVIATNIGGTKEVLSEDYTTFLDPKDQQAWYEKIKELLENDKDRQILAELGKKDVAKYQWEKIMKKLVKLYEDLTTNAAVEPDQIIEK